MKWIKEKPKDFDAALQKIGLEPLSSKVLFLDEQHRMLQDKVQGLQQLEQEMGKGLGDIKDKRGDEFQRARKQYEEFKNQLSKLQDDTQARDELNSILDVVRKANRKM